MNSHCNLSVDRTLYKCLVIEYECQIAWLRLIPAVDPQVDKFSGGQVVCLDLTTGTRWLTMGSFSNLDKD